MRINVEFLGFPTASDVVGKKKMSLDIPGNTVKHAIDELIRLYGRKIKDSFYDEKGNLDVTIQMMLNGKLFAPAGIQSPSLNERDTLTFMLLLAGG